MVISLLGNFDLSSPLYIEENLKTHLDKLKLYRELKTELEPSSPDRLRATAQPSSSSSTGNDLIRSALCCLRKRRRRNQPTCDRSQSHIDKHAMPSTNTISGGVHQTVEELMRMHLTDEQILSIAMCTDDESNPFQMILQGGLLQVC